MDSDNTSAPMNEAGPGGGSPEGGTGPAILTLRGGHPEEYQRLAHLQNNGYVRDRDDPNPERRAHEWHYRGNPEWWVDDRWNMSQLEKHHQLNIALARMENASPEVYEALMADVSKMLEGMS